MHPLLHELVAQQARVEAEQDKFNALAQRCADELCIAKPGDIVESLFERRAHRKQAVVDRVFPAKISRYSRTGDTPHFSCYVLGHYLNSRGEVSKLEFSTHLPLRDDATGQEDRNRFYKVVV